MTDRPDKGQQSKQTPDDAAISANAPVQPVENFDPAKPNKDRRIFQNGDTDRITEQD
ncbi:hypothetical protein ABID21_004755 [Pseudorhizobium tarimense]|uniref:Uncharacterized protein n=1 Tax=Pseudorhizobium tarimense TaxID=1079109 RepID=A0ABV2HDN2_9HYPH|nr:hypothetical protein [Pseudorhizobium tarimense]MCJ8521639.1 hypothetical protein [Pseudorhizobium tarimense]